MPIKNLSVYFLLLFHKMDYVNIFFYSFCLFSIHKDEDTQCSIMKMYFVPTRYVAISTIYFNVQQLFIVTNFTLQNKYITFVIYLQTSGSIFFFCEKLENMKTFQNAFSTNQTKLKYFISIHGKMCTNICVLRDTPLITSFALHTAISTICYNVQRISVAFLFYAVE